MYKVKAVKTFTGMEGHGFNANLYRGTKKVGSVHDYATGGCLDYDFTNKFEEKRFWDFQSTLGHGEYSEDTYVNLLVDNYLKTKDAKKLLRKASFFVPSEKAIYSFNGKYEGNELSIKAHLEKNHPDDHVILNGIHITQVIDYMEAH